MKHYQMTGIALLLLAGMVSAATLQMQVAAYNITGLGDGDSMWEHAWPDSSGNGRDANAPVSYWSPTYETGEAGKFNSQDYVYFSNQNYMSGAASLSSWGFTAMAVANFDSSATLERTIISFYDADVSTRYLTFSILDDGNLRVVYREGSWPQYILETTDQDFRDADHLFTVDYQGATDISVYVDGETVSLTYSGSGTPSITLSEIDSYRLRNAGNGTQNTDIAEARYYTGTWDAGELETVEQGLMSTYGIPEPVTMTIVGMGSLLLLRRRKRA